MSKIRRYRYMIGVEPWGAMPTQSKKPTQAQIKAKEAYQLALADTTNLCRVMARLAQYSGDAVFLNAGELEQIIRIPDIDYRIVCQQIDDRNLASCGQGGYYHIKREILNQWKAN